MPGRAVLLWSTIHRGPLTRRQRTRRIAQRTWAALAATVVGTMFTLATLGSAVLFIDLVLRSMGFTSQPTLLIVLGLAAASMLATGWRATHAFLVEKAREHHMLRIHGTPTWRLDLLGAVDKGQGFGGALLDAFTERADAAMAQVFLLTLPQNQHFYRRHGFRSQPTIDLGGMLLMRRHPPRKSARAA